MSKEQTPITVEEKSLAYYAKNCADELIKTPISVLRYISELEQKVADNEQYAQAKVLEALEGEIEQAFIYGYNTGCFDSFTQPLEIQSIPAAEKYYETEVKPNYTNFI